MPALYILCALLLGASVIADKKKSVKALRISLKKLLNILPAFGIMLILISILIYLIPEETIIEYLGSGNSLRSAGAAAVIGSIAMFPGFIAFPLCGILRDSGVTWSVIAAFSTSLMLVGIATFPVEKQYLGFKTALLRNLTAFVMAMLISIVIGIFYGEIF